MRKVVNLLWLSLFFITFINGAHAATAATSPESSTVSVELIAHVITQLNPQAQQQGWRWKHEYPRYYQPEQIEKYARYIHDTALKYKQDWRYLTAIIQEQSRFQYDAISTTRDYGISQIHCGPSSPYCRYPVRKNDKQKLFDPQWNIDALGQWLVTKQERCAEATKHSEIYKRCKLNQKYTKIPGLLGMPWKTGRILKRIDHITKEYLEGLENEA